MYQISDDIMNFFEKTMKTRRVELTAGEKSLTEAKIQRCIFQGDAQSPLLFVIEMMPLNRILRKCTAGYKQPDTNSLSTFFSELWSVQVVIGGVVRDTFFCYHY